MVQKCPKTLNTSSTLGMDNLHNLKITLNAFRNHFENRRNLLWEIQPYIWRGQIRTLPQHRKATGGQSTRPVPISGKRRSFRVFDFFMNTFYMQLFRKRKEPAGFVPIFDDFMNTFYMTGRDEKILKFAQFLSLIFVFSTRFELILVCLTCEDIHLQLIFQMMSRTKKQEGSIIQFSKTFRLFRKKS